jgi:protein transport protein SEC20
MSLEGLQERLAALQETTSQLRTLIGRLANLEFAPGSVPLRADEENTVSAELSSEIGQILREEEDELEVLREEVEDLRAGRPGGETEHMKVRLRDALGRLDKELAV